MSKRKQTPDILAEILEGDAPGGETSVDYPPVQSRRAPASPPAPSKPAVSRRAIEKPVTTRPARWEYRLASFQDHNGWRLRYLDGREVKGWMDGLRIEEALQQMGDEGWELAAASAGERLYGSTDKHQLYFKRRI
jgi:hypothetical protein